MPNEETTPKPPADCKKSGQPYGVTGTTPEERSVQWKKMREDHRKKFPRRVGLINTKDAAKALIREALVEDD
jgi:hypothetical protein